VRRGGGGDAGGCDGGNAGGCGSGVGEAASSLLDVTTAASMAAVCSVARCWTWWRNESSLVRREGGRVAAVGAGVSARLRRYLGSEFYCLFFS
jgi:hypothetical protein